MGSSSRGSDSKRHRADCPVTERHRIRWRVEIKIMQLYFKRDHGRGGVKFKYWIGCCKCQQKWKVPRHSNPLADTYRVTHWNDDGGGGGQWIATATFSNFGTHRFITRQKAIRDAILLVNRWIRTVSKGRRGRWGSSVIDSCWNQRGRMGNGLFRTLQSM